MAENHLPGPGSKSTSAHWFRRGKSVIAGGASRDAILREPHPIYAAYAGGCYVTDVDGKRYVDFVNNMASLIHGHAFGPVVEAIAEQIKRGTAYTLGTPSEVLFAEHLVARNPAFERIRFVNSGTEAVMAMLKAARAYTGRPKIAKVEGAYHGSYDYAEVSQNATPADWGDYKKPSSVALSSGTPKAVPDDVVVIPFNDATAAVQILDQYRSSIAGVLIDPIPHRVGLLRASQSFIDALRSWTTDAGALLLFDEVITFRTEVGGAQLRFGMRPDLTSLGKIIGGGFPVGAVAGRADVMAVFTAFNGPAKLPMSGTFNANPVTMTAGRVAMEHFDAEAVRSLNRLGDQVRSILREVISQVGANASVTGAGSMFRLHVFSPEPSNYREAYVGGARKARLTIWLNELLERGIMLANTGSGMLSTVMGEREVTLLRDAVRESLQKAG